ncbi:ion transporter [Alloalcanivorax profundimaris]|uniref:ion transporter n=1 Tax=Alloalcanivorax profundimaris TaxID=2735259 RepID=UPI0018879E7E|nr:ion transporter [Alloalcanivorax profundimaris]MBF1801561.1 ion transporter [Alloalcanivorax profundimaris]MCQ6261553.1 ion transporter [Alcanivorax sp. MM125-6]
MSVHFHLKKLRPGLDTLGFLIDVLMILLVVVNLSLILFDWVYRVETVQELLRAWVPGFFTFYKEQVHAHFFEIDLAFVTVYLTEFVIRWAVAIARGTYHRWFFYPFVHWYDLLGCIPVGSFRWLRILRVVSLMFRLQKMGVVDFRDTYIGRSVIKYYRILVEEVSDRVVINVLEGAQREIRTGGPMMHRIERDVLAPRREQLVDYLAGRIADATRRSHDQYRDRLSEYLVYLTDEAVHRTAAGRRLAAIPVAGPRAIDLLGDTVRDGGSALVDQLVEDVSSPANRPRLDALIDDLLSASHGGTEQLNEMVKQTLLEILDHVKAQVAVQHWKEEEPE